MSSQHEHKHQTPPTALDNLKVPDAGANEKPPAGAMQLPPIPLPDPQPEVKFDKVSHVTNQRARESSAVSRQAT